MIIRMNDKYTSELNDFIYKYNNLKEHFIAWLPDNYEKITELDKSNFLICIEENKIVGCLGFHLSLEQKVARLLGPLIKKEYHDKYEDFYNQSLIYIPEEINEIKIAFLEENTLCRHLCEKNNFELYNTEKTMIYTDSSRKLAKEQCKLRLIPYEAKYRNGLELVHPKNTFFTIDELIDGTNNSHNLLLATINKEVMGYICYEQTKDNSNGEIILLHVRQDKRGKGYGSMLLNKAIDNLTDSGIKEISIYVRVDNFKAQKLYMATGFKEKETIYAYRKQLG